MNNEITANATQHYNFDFTNPLVTATLVLTVGICYCVTVSIAAKYNHYTELTYGNFSLKIKPSIPTIAAVPT